MQEALTAERMPAQRPCDGHSTRRRGVAWLTAMVRRVVVLHVFVKVAKDSATGDRDIQETVGERALTKLRDLKERFIARAGVPRGVCGGRERVAIVETLIRARVAAKLTAGGGPVPSLSMNGPMRPQPISGNAIAVRYRAHGADGPEPTREPRWWRTRHVASLPPPTLLPSLSSTRSVDRQPTRELPSLPTMRATSSSPNPLTAEDRRK